MKARSQAAFDAVRRGHRRETVLELWTPDGFVGNIPIEDGSLSVTLSRSSGSGQRSGTVRTPDYGLWPSVKTSAYAWVDAYISINDEPFHLGEWPIVKAVASRPGGYIELTLGDWAFRRILWKAESPFTIAASLESISAMVSRYMATGWPITVTQDDTAGAFMLSDVILQLGGSVWDAVTEAANQRQAIVMMTSRNTAQVRIFDPYQPYMEDLRDTIVSDTAGLTAEPGLAVNKVLITVQGSGADQTTYTSTQTLTSGDYAYGPDFGYAPYIDNIRLPTASQALADQEAARIASRRFGVMRLAQVDVVSQPWIEVGDIVAYIPVVGVGATPGPEYFAVETVTYPLASGPMRLAMREAGVA
jgi:hypothetical protein